MVHYNVGRNLDYIYILRLASVLKSRSVQGMTPIFDSGAGRVMNGKTGHG